VIEEQRATRLLHEIVESAVRAPSVHNTQPWRWLGAGDTLELHADRSRQLLVTDPDGRDLLISCGCALHHALVAAAAMGWTADVTRLPDPVRPDLLARIVLSHGPVTQETSVLLEAIARRTTDRRRFTAWPVPEERLATLVSHADAWQAEARPVTEVEQRFRADLLVNHAVDLRRADPAAARERDAWVGPGDCLEDVDGRAVEGSDGLILMYGDGDEPATWLRTGEGLGALWLAATLDGLSVVPLSQVIGVEHIRESLRREVLGRLAQPMLALRVSWQAIGRSQFPRSPRRPVDQVLELV